MRVARLLAPVLLAAISMPAIADTPAAGDKPWLNASATTEQRVASLLAQMTTDEKVAMLHGPMAMPLFGMTLPEGAIGSAGYIPGNARLGIPALQESDASLGVTNPMMVRGPEDMSTALPSSLLLAASFDPSMAYAGGQMVGREARAKGINVQLAGGVNLARDPRNGRNFEYLGEDPLLAGILAGDAIRGIQSEGLISTIKHFALNGQEHHRMTADSIIGDAAARESDLLAFEIAIERGHPGSVMCSYNLINSDYGCENEWLLNKVLKKDWGYKGFVMSDWGAVHSLGALGDGLDQQSGEQLDKQVWFDKPLKAGLADGSVSMKRVDDAVSRILTAMFEHGLFDEPAKKGAIDYEANSVVALQQATGGIVLLKNDGNVLPIADTAKKIAVIGGHADAGVPSGGGSSQVTNPWRKPGTQLRSLPMGGEGMMGAWNNIVFHPSSPLAALRARFPEAKVTFDTGAYPSAAAAAAKDADVVVVFAYQPSNEGSDAPDMSLPYGQDGLIAAVAAANPKTVVVLETGNPVTMPWAAKVPAIVEAWYSGQRGGEAIADVLSGVVNPSGRLPLSWPVDESQLPRPVIPGTGTPEGTMVKVDYTIEGADVGYRWFARKGTEPRYWFGHGLSYTSFAYSGLALGKDAAASVTVTNSGQKAGQTVAQLYLLNTPKGAERRLLGFQKVALEPGQSKSVQLTIDPRLLADFDEKSGQWKIAAGTYELGVGTDANTMVQKATVKLAGRSIKP